VANFLVTGGAGFIGSHLVERLAALGHSTWAIDAFTDFYSPQRKHSNLRHLQASPRFHLISGDLNEPGVIPEVPFDFVIHLAGQPGVSSSWGDAFLSHARNNLIATQRLLEAVSRGPRPRAFAFASSSSVYGNGTNKAFREEDQPNPLSPYAVSKLSAEFLCRAYEQAFSIPVCILRLFTVFGPRQRPDMALATFLDAAREGRTVTIYGELEQQRDYTYIGDVVRAMVTAAEREVSGTINVGGGNPVTMATCLASIGRITGSELRYRVEHARTGEAHSTRADPAKARRLLSFEPSVSFEQGLLAQWLSTCEAGAFHESAAEKALNSSAD
jgi:UDP-glucuronate 4-epimerase